MRFAGFRTFGVGFAAAAAVAVFGACTDTPTDTSGYDGTEAIAFSQGDKDQKIKPTLQYARVKSDGTLVDGTALSASRFSVGVYEIKFEPPIGGCAASANSAAFLGFDGSAFRIMAQISIGFGLGGGFDDETVRVSLFDNNGASDDSSFTVILVCP